MTRPLGDKWLVAQTVVLLAATRLAIMGLTYQRLERLLGERLVESTTEATPIEIRGARKVAWAIRSVSPYTPWTSNCFPQALTAKVLLGRRGISSTLCIGAAFAEDKSALEAHAWLRCGPMYVTGGDGSNAFGAIVSYA